MTHRLLLLGVVLLMAIAACGDDSPVFAGSTTSPTTPVDSSTTAPSTTEAPTTTDAPTTTIAPTTTDGTAAPPDTSPPVTATTLSGPSARDSLLDYIAGVEDLDRDIGDAAALFNESWESTGVISQDAITAIEALDATPLRDLIPPGLVSDLETAVLAVYADLDSRVSALHGAVRFESIPEDVMICLELGAISFRRFDDDFARMLDLADRSPAPTAAADSVEAGILATRLETIHGLNWGCDSCGGFEYEEPIPVDWDGRTIFGEVGFEANFDGSRWEILIYAC